MSEEVFDLDAAKARRMEESGGPVHFRFGGEDFTLMPLSEWPMGVLDDIADGSIMESLRRVLGDDYERFAAMSPSIGDVNALIEWMSQTSTGSPGN